MERGGRRGFELAAAAYVRVAASTAFVGGGGAVRIARLIGSQHMGNVMLTPRTVGPKQMEALERHFLCVVPQGQAA